MSLKTSEFDWEYSMDEVDPDERTIFRKNLNKFISLMEAFMIIQVSEAFLSMGKGFRKGRL